MPAQKSQPTTPDAVSRVVERIRTSDNVLVALSKDPSVDELSAALGLTFILDKLGKHATAIFSGAVPNAIEFLEPEKTFETNTNSLQDFIIALDKEKADHLRYKIDGDYVKVFITPYRTTLDQSDMEFSHGDYNVDLVISLNVKDTSDLDNALSEYGRIMHDATSINISAAEPGHFGDIEWGDPESSSISEMVVKMAQKTDEKDIFDKAIATALLAGIVAATNRFSNERTKPETLSLAAKLMEAGADQQLISSSIPVDILTANTVDVTDEVATAMAAPAAAAPTLEQVAAAQNAAPAEAPVVAPVEAAPAEATPTESAPVAEAAPAPAEAEAPAPAAPADPTTLEIRHGEVDFDPDEDDPERMAEKERLKAREAELAAQAAKEHEHIDAEIAAIRAKAAEREGKVLSDLPSRNPAPAAPAPVPLPKPVAPGSVEAAAAEAELEKITAPAAPAASDPLMDDLQNAASAGTKKKIEPINEVLNRPVEKVDYASMMDEALKSPDPGRLVDPPLELADKVNETQKVGSIPMPTPAVDIATAPDPILAAPAPMPVSAPVPAPAPAPEPIPTPVPVPAPAAPELVTPPLPMPGDGSLLPPPPIPFDPGVAMGAEPSAADIASAIQNEQGPTGGSSYIVGAPAEPAMPAPTAAPAPQSGSGYVGSNPALQADADPGAFQIPTMA